MAEAQSRDEVLEKVAVLEDPLKAAILTLLMRRPASIAEVASELDLPIGRARYQLRRLHQAGMVELTEVRPRRGVVERVYRRQPSIVSADEVGLLSVEERGKAVATVLKLVFREALSALRTGVRLIPMRATTARSATRAPGGSWPAMINERSSLYTRVTLSTGVRDGALPFAGRAAGRLARLDKDLGTTTRYSSDESASKKGERPFPVRDRSIAVYQNGLSGSPIRY